MPETDFDAVYQRDHDPFGVGSRWYERRKEGLLLAALAQERYRLAWDTACGTGHLARALGERCDRVVASDASPTAVGLTRERTAALGTVHVETSALPAVPDAATAADLVVVAEVLYYLAGDARRATIERLAAGRGEVVAVSWRHLPEDAATSGADSVAELGAGLVGRGWTAAVHHDEPDFVLASWTRS